MAVYIIICIIVSCHRLIIIIIIIIIIIEFLTAQLWLRNIHLSWDVVSTVLGSVVLFNLLLLLLLLLLLTVWLPIVKEMTIKKFVPLLQSLHNSQYPDCTPSVFDVREQFIMLKY